MSTKDFLLSCRHEISVDKIWKIENALLKHVWEMHNWFLNLELFDKSQAKIQSINKSLIYTYFILFFIDEIRATTNKTINSSQNYCNTYQLFLLLSIQYIDNCDLSRYNNGFMYRYQAFPFHACDRKRTHRHTRKPKCARCLSHAWKFIFTSSWSTCLWGETNNCTYFVAVGELC